MYRGQDTDPAPTWPQAELLAPGLSLTALAVAGIQGVDQSGRSLSLPPSPPLPFQLMKITTLLGYEVHPQGCLQSYGRGGPCPKADPWLWGSGLCPQVLAPMAPAVFSLPPAAPVGAAGLLGTGLPPAMALSTEQQWDCPGGEPQLGTVGTPGHRATPGDLLPRPSLKGTWGAGAKIMPAAKKLQGARVWHSDQWRQLSPQDSCDRSPAKLQAAKPWVLTGGPHRGAGARGHSLGLDSPVPSPA